MAKIEISIDVRIDIEQDGKNTLKKYVVVKVDFPLSQDQKGFNSENLDRAIEAAVKKWDECESEVSGAIIETTFRDSCI